MSIYNSPVERSWGDTNLVTRKWKLIFVNLEQCGHLDVASNSDKFSLISTFYASVASDVDAHYMAISKMKKSKRTTSPNYPVEKQRRCALYQSYPSCGTPLSPEEASAVREVGRAFWQEIERPSPWQIDPLSTQALRDQRAAALVASRPYRTLAEEYMAHRALTLQLAII